MQQVLVAGRYRLDRRIGQGGMGEVWQASDEVLGRPVALKLLLGEHADAQAAARFRLEAQTAARLNHPHVVAVFDFGTWDGRFYLVMELIPGRSLAEELTADGGGLAPERVAVVAAHTAAGLASAHRQGIVHRDIKPGNLLSDAEGTVKIADFGIARFVNDPSAALTTTGQIVGTSLYLAPERALGRTAEPASDVYALGCVLYQLITGQPPFRADTPTATLYQHIDAVPVPPIERGARLSPAFQNFLLVMLAKQPEDRPTADEVAAWFASDAWQGRSRPMPAPRPAAAPPAAPRPAPVPSPAEAGPATTYMLPGSRPPGRGHRSARKARPDVRAAFRRRPRVATAAAGAVAFTAAVLIGMALFSPDESSAGTPLTDPAPSATAGESGGGAGSSPSAEPAGRQPSGDTGAPARPAKGADDAPRKPDDGGRHADRHAEEDEDD
ncbi:serine/threonine-protein kinase [Streptomyces genisteinicus]|uniref:serine/threonine-protein kinase n=1 Tax=Streptomyces genisteinicus TaxID=2768068 RepID=UPI0024844485|nr:serine/threonine-protein kinase [Streptomyces genisteinicus]